MVPSPMQQQQPMDINTFQTMMMNVAYNACAVVTTPVEMLLRPHYGSEYVSPITMFFTAVMMIFLPFFSAMSDMLPFMRSQAAGLFDIGTLSRLFFLGSFVHGLRIWRRMIHMETEENSYFAGPPLPIFRLLPFSWWVIRIIVEPIAVFALSVVLHNLFVLQSSAANYLYVSAVMLAFKEYVEWYMHWKIIRHAMNMHNIGPVIAKIIDNTASDDDLAATVHLASFPKNLPEDVRQTAASHIGRLFGA